MSDSQRKSSKLLLRGESTIASAGLILAVVMLGAVAGSAWLSSQTQQAAEQQARGSEIQSVGAMLSGLSRSMLAAGELSTLRLYVAEAAHRHNFSTCRIVLSSGDVIAAASASDISLASLPESWPTEPVSNTMLPLPGDRLTLQAPFEVPGRGAARLDIAAAPAPVVSGWDAQTGIGLLGALALLALLLVYRHIRSRLRALSYISDSLLSLDGGETDIAALTVQESLGPTARAWNELLSERERLQQVLVTKRLLELPAARGERSRDLTSMCDAMTQGLVLVDSNLSITYANGASALYLGVPYEAMLGETVERILVNEDVLTSVRGIASGVIRRGTSLEVDRTGEDVTGVLRYNVRPVRRDDESAAMIVIEDITQQRMASESRNTFVAQVTHELRTPLTNILLYAETAMDNGEQDEATRAKCLNVINQEAKRLNRIVSDMLSVAELEAGTHEARLDDLSLANLFEDLKLDYEAAATEQKVELTFDLPPNLPTIHADRDKIALAVHNLLGNAIKYTPAGGSVTVRADCTDDLVTMKVTDTGIGLAEEEQERIFEKFYRAKDDRIAGITGSGLGLALARDVVRLHGGDITVDSELNRGSTFTLTVPILTRAAAA